MELSVSIALRNTLGSLVVALVTSPGIGINALGGMKKLACLSHRSLLILMVVCAIGSIVLLLLVLNWFDCLLGLMLLSLWENHMHLKNTLELLIILNLFQSLGKPPLETCLNTSLIGRLSL